MGSGFDNMGLSELGSECIYTASPFPSTALFVTPVCGNKWDRRADNSMHLHLYLVLPQQQDNYSKASPLSGSDKKTILRGCRVLKCFCSEAKDHLFKKRKSVKIHFAPAQLFSVTFRFKRAQLRWGRKSGILIFKYVAVRADSA